MRLMCAILAAVALSTPALTGESRSNERITVAGSSTIRPIVQKATTAFCKTHAGVTFVVGGGGSSHGVKSTALGQVQLGLASRDLKTKETKQWTNLVPVKIGLDGIAIIVSGKNPVTSITKAQLADIYTGKITNWSQIGGNNSPIVLISKEEGRSTLELFLKYCGLESKEVKVGRKMVMVHRIKETEEFSSVTAKLIGPNNEAIAAVSTKPNAIAYVSIGTAQEIARKGGRIRLLTLDGVVASVANVTKETYPLRRPLNLLTRGEPKGTVKQFIDFMLSDDGQRIVQSLEFVPLRPLEKIKK